MPYPEQLVAPMRTDLTEVGFKELRTPEEVDAVIPGNQGTVLLVVNSVCGCAAGSARPAIKDSLTHGKSPDHLYTVFAGQEVDATNQARKHTLPYPPSSPCIALFKDGKLVHFIERHVIEGGNAALLSENLQAAYTEFC
jgi:bacilliredoxin